MKRIPTVTPRMMPVLTEQEESWFWSWVDIRDDDQCWIWKGEPYQSGYAKCIIRRRNFVAHRIAYWLWNAEQPGVLRVCHKCDNQMCCNPHHLFLGTPQDNVDDMIRKGRAHWQRAIA